ERVVERAQPGDLEAIGPDARALDRLQALALVLADPLLDQGRRHRDRAGAEHLERVEIERERLARVLLARVPGEAALGPRADVDQLGADLTGQLAEDLERAQEAEPDQGVA